MISLFQIFCNFGRAQRYAVFAWPSVHHGLWFEESDPRRRHLLLLFTRLCLSRSRGGRLTAEACRKVRVRPEPRSLSRSHPSPSFTCRCRALKTTLAHTVWGKTSTFCNLICSTSKRLNYHPTADGLVLWKVEVALSVASIERGLRRGSDGPCERWILL